MIKVRPKKTSKLKIHANCIWNTLVLLRVNSAPSSITSVEQKKDRRLTKKKGVCTQTETLADCHFIFKVDGTEERYSSAFSRSLQPPFFTVSAVPDHISLDNLILTFRTRTWLRQLFLLVSLLFLPFLFLYIYLLRHFVLYLSVYRKSYVAVGCKSRINFPPALSCWT